jgi:uncharacterized membrane protein YeaQ/YmgE (transglycosylase-associated protein family)
MEWSLTNLLIQIFTGILGGHAAATAVKEHSFGAWGHTAAGAIGGGLSGLFLQTLAATMVSGAGTFNEPKPVEQVILQGLTGAIAGAIAMLIVGFITPSIGQNKS